MRLKKFLAVALAATTALSSGVAYDMLGASVEKAQAGYNGDFKSAGETFTVKDKSQGVTFTYKVINPILNGQTTAQGDSLGKNGNVDNVWATNGIYDGDNGIKTSYTYGSTSGSATQIGTVALIGVTEDTDTSNNWGFTIPESVDGFGEIGTGATSFTYFDYIDNDGATKGSMVDGDSSNHGTYYVTEVDLDGDSINKADKVNRIDVTSGKASNISSLKVQGFKALADIKSGNSTAQFLNASTIDVSGTNLNAAVISSMLGQTSPAGINAASKIETLDVSSLENKGAGLTIAVTTGAPLFNIKSVDIHGNADAAVLVIGAAHNKGVTVNVSDCANLKVLKTSNAVLANPMNDRTKLRVSTYDAPNLRGFKFITDGSTASTDVNLSFMQTAEYVDLSYSGIRSFDAPTFIAKDSDATQATLIGNLGGAVRRLDVSDNALTSVSLSSAANATSVDVSNNKLLECDISGLSNASNIDVSYNYLTSLDASSLETNLKGLTLNKNFISADNFSKTDKQTGISLTDQRSADVFKWAYVGDMGQASGTTSKAYIKLGGTGTLIGAMVVRGAPEGFAEKLASTIKWTESNTSETSAITLGDQATVQATETAYNLAMVGQGYLSGVVVSAGITANATKAAAEKVTLQYGNTKQDINIANDNVVLVNYDITSAIESENIKNDNKYTVTYAQMMFPTEAFILNSNGTVDATLTSTKVLADTEDSALTKAVSGDFNEIIDQTLRKMEGVTFTKWNTAVDGTGTAVATGGKLKAIEADTTVYANYTENTYNVSFNSNMRSTKVNVTGTTGSLQNVKFGEDTTLTSNGFSTSKGNYYGWLNAADGKFYSDGQSIHGIAAKNKKTESVAMQAFYGDSDHYINVASDKTSLSLVVGDAEEGAVLLEDLKPVVNGDPTEGKKDGQVGVDLGYSSSNSAAAVFGKGADAAGINNYEPTGKVNFRVYSSDNNVVEIVGKLGKGNSAVNVIPYAVAKGPGTANIYVRDNTYGNLATISVTVQSKDEAEAAALAKKEAAAANKAIEAGEKTDVSKYSKFAATIVKNADGENTVTVTKGKNVATAKINTITIGDKTYTVTRIGANAYKGMSKLKTVTTSNQVKVVGKAAFANCKKLTKVTLGKKVAKIGANAFKGDKKLAKIMIKSKKLTTKAKVGKNSFKGIKATAKFYIAKKAATYKKVKKAIKAQSGAPKKAKYVKKYA